MCPLGEELPLPGPVASEVDMEVEAASESAAPACEACEALAKPGKPLVLTKNSHKRSDETNYTALFCTCLLSDCLIVLSFACYPLVGVGWGEQALSPQAAALLSTAIG